MAHFLLMCIRWSWQYLKAPGLCKWKVLVTKSILDVQDSNISVLMRQNLQLSLIHSIYYPLRSSAGSILQRHPLQHPRVLRYTRHNQPVPIQTDWSRINDQMRWALAFSHCCWLQTFRRHCHSPHNQKTYCNQNWAKRSTTGSVALGRHKSSAVTASIKPERSPKARQHILCLLHWCTTAPVGGIVKKQRAKKLGAAVPKKCEKIVRLWLLQTNYANCKCACAADKFLHICTIANTQVTSVCFKTPAGSLLRLLWWYEAATTLVWTWRL